MAFDTQCVLGLRAMGESTAVTCPAQSRGRRVKHGESHTVTCQLEPGHDGLHRWHDGASRLVMWGGPAQPAPDNTRFRYGKWLEAK